MARKVSNEEILDDAKRVLEQCGKLNQNIYEKYGRYSLGLIYKRFGGMKNLLKELGIEWVCHRKLDKQALIEDIRRVYNKHGYLKKELYVKYGKYSCTAIRGHFGSFNNMLKELGYEINMHKRPRKEEVVKACWNIYRKYGYITAELQRKESGYSQTVVDRLFGGFIGLMKAMGLEPNEVRLSDDELISELKAIYSKYGHINSVLINNECSISYTAVSTRLGGKEGIIAALGIPADKFIADDVSEAARLVMNYLTRYLDEEPIIEKTWDWLRNSKTGRLMYVDMYYPSYNLAVEYDGEQHFKFVPWYYEEYEAFHEYVERDKIKTKLLAAHGVKLIRYSYQDDLTYDGIVKKLIDTLGTSSKKTA